MKKYILTQGILLFSLFGASANAQELTGTTLSANNSSPAASASSLMFTVVSPDCIYDQWELNSLLSFAQSSPSTENIANAAFVLLGQGFNPLAVRLFVVAELCGLE